SKKLRNWPISCVYQSLSKSQKIQKSNFAIAKFNFKLKFLHNTNTDEQKNIYGTIRKQSFFVRKIFMRM
uniref:hypothetical protein n=1 Tax=Vibrio vulnificus TaxID=672 RepID=UPI0019D48DB0